jgi:predicted nucleic acid-binding protein
VVTSSTETNSTSAERYTLDTNILIYAVDRSGGAKHRVAIEIVDCSIERSCILTVQALAEFVFAVTRKALIPREEAVAQARDWLTVFPIVAADGNAPRGRLQRHKTAAYSAIEQERFGLFDALLLATAAQAGCTIALSADMHDGARRDCIVVRNPFADGALADDLRPLLGL